MLPPHVEAEVRRILRSEARLALDANGDAFGANPGADDSDLDNSLDQGPSTGEGQPLPIPTRSGHDRLKAA